MIKSSILLFCVVVVVNCRPAPSESEFSTCKNQYSNLIGHVISSAGLDAATTVYQLIFRYLDLDFNGKVTASEIAICMEKENLIGDKDILQIMEEAEAWISSGEEETELNQEVFDKLTQRTFGTGFSPSSNILSLVTNMCQIFVHKIPELTWAMQDLANCTAQVKNEEKQLLDIGSERVALNTWYAVFNTIDSNNDGIVDVHELKMSLNMEMNIASDKMFNEAFSHVLGGTAKTPKNITEAKFYNLVTTVIFGQKRKSAWEDVKTLPELHGRVYFCDILRKIDYAVKMQRLNNADCTRVYEGVANIILGEDKIYAPAIIFTMTDTNRDGLISQPEFEAFSGSPFFFDMNSDGMSLNYFTSLTPDHIEAIAKTVDVKNETRMWELSRMSLLQLVAEEKLCTAMISALKLFPHRPDVEIPYPTRTTSSTPLFEDEVHEIHTTEEMENVPGEAEQPHIAVAVEGETSNIMPPVEEIIEEENSTLPPAIEEKIHEVAENISNHENKELPLSEPGHSEHLTTDLKTLIKEGEAQPPSEEEAQLQTLLQRIEEMEVHPTPQIMEEPQEIPLLSTNEEEQLKELLDNLLLQQGGRYKEEPIIEQ